jgi:circadian clock protein KaiC
LRESFESLKDELSKTYEEEQLRKDILKRNRDELAQRRYLNSVTDKKGNTDGKEE